MDAGEEPGGTGLALGDGTGETAGVAVLVAKAGMGTVCGTAGAEVSGWIGIGEVCGAFCTGVAAGRGVSCAGLA